MECIRYYWRLKSQIHLFRLRNYTYQNTQQNADSIPQVGNLRRFTQVMKTHELLLTQHLKDTTNTESLNTLTKVFIETILKVQKHLSDIKTHRALLLSSSRWQVSDQTQSAHRNAIEIESFLKKR